MATKLIGERLPQNWSYAVTKDGRIFFVDDSSRWTTWLHPVTREPVQTGFSSVQGLPAGWEQALSIDGTIYFIDHNQRITTFNHPLTGHSVMEGHFTTPPKFAIGKGNQNRKSSKSHVKPPVTAREETSNVIMKGWLQKQETGGLKLWKKRWCVLADFGLFFYKDESERSCTGSILLPSFTIGPCGAHDVNKKFAFKAEHKNLKTLYFCADRQSEMEKWVQALQMSALVQRAHGSGHVPEVIPKSSVMSWDVDSRDFAPDRCQYLPSNSYEIASRSAKLIDDGFRERTPLQSKESSQNSSDLYFKQFDSNPSGELIFNVERFSMDDRVQEARQDKHFNSRYFADINNREGESLKINQGQRLPNDQRSLSSSSQFSSSTLPRDVRPGDLSDNRGQGPFQGQTYHSLPRDPRFIPGGVTDSHFAMRHADKHEDRGRVQVAEGWERVPADVRRHLNKIEDNPFVTTTLSQQMDDRMMDPTKHSSRPFLQDPPPQPMHNQVQTGDGDYASPTRTRNKLQNQKQSDSNAGGPPSHTKSNLTQAQQRPDLYIDIPHTYVNVSDESQFRGDATNLPMRPPLPIEIRHRIVEDIAKAHTPNTQREILIAEDNLEKRMQQPPFFNYPTPTCESLPSFPQNSPTSHYSERSRLQQEQDWQPQLPKKPDTLSIPIEHWGKRYSKTQGQKGSRMPDYIKTQGQKNSRMPQTIQTVKEDEDMPDSQVIVTALPPKVFPLSGPRLRMSISASDLLGKTHDELVLLLIQLQRDKADLTEQRDEIRKNIEQCRAIELYYRKLENGNQPVDVDTESQHRKYQELKHKLEEAEKKLEVYKPLVNLIGNMVTMGSLYGGDNLMLATEYRKHLLSPEQYSQPKQMIEFSRRHQEELVVQEIEDDVKELTKEQADLEEKLRHLCELEKIMQNQSFQVGSLKEDREMLENTLDGLLKMQDHHCKNQRELDQLVQQQKIVEKELSRVLQQLTEASKELEETTAENNKLQYEVSLLRTKVHGNVTHSKNTPSLSGESLQTKMKMEKDLARVKNLMEGLSEEGAKLQEMMSSLRKSKSMTDEQKSFSKDSEKIDNKTQKGSTYFETDIDTNESKDLAMVAALLAAYQLLPSQSARELNPEPLSHQASVNTCRKPPSSAENGDSAFRTVSTREDTAVSQVPLVNAIQLWQPQPDLEADCGNQNDTGLFPRNVQKQQTVRDAVKQAEMWKKQEDDPPPLCVSLNLSDYPNSIHHVYENLPQQQLATMTIDKPPRVTILPGGNVPTSTTSRWSNMNLLTAKPFTLYNSRPTPFSSVNSSSSLYNSQKLDKVNATVHDRNIQLDQSQPFLFENNFENSKLKNSYKLSEPITSQNSSKAPPPPPVRGTSKYYATNQQSLRDIFMNNVSNENYESPEPAILKKGKTNRNLQKARYLTISSSEPMKLEQSWPQSPQLHSQAGDLISSMEIPDIVKSSTTRSAMYDEKAIDREIMFYPEKVNISERYIPDSDDEYNMSEEERSHRLEKADKIKEMLTNQSIHSLSQPDISNVAIAGEVHERAQQEKQKRAFLLGISQELAEQVKLKSRQIAETYATNKDHQNSAEDRYGGDRNLEDRNKNSRKDVGNNDDSQNCDSSRYEHNKSLYGHNTYTSKRHQEYNLY